MTVVDPKFGGEVITKKGKTYKFDDLICMVHFLKSGFLKESDIKQNVVINFEKQNNFLDVKNSFFFLSPELNSPMGGNAAGFSSQQEAEKFKAQKEGSIVNWTDLNSSFK
jgi:copper chaperone NosL